MTIKQEITQACQQLQGILATLASNDPDQSLDIKSLQDRLEAAETQSRDSSLELDLLRDRAKQADNRSTQWYQRAKNTEVVLARYRAHSDKLLTVLRERDDKILALNLENTQLKEDRSLKLFRKAAYVDINH